MLSERKQFSPSFLDCAGGLANSNDKRQIGHRKHFYSYTHIYRNSEEIVTQKYS